MPYYTFINKETGEQWESEMMTISEMEELLASDSNLDVLPGTPGFGDAWRLGLKKPSDGFRDKLREMQRKLGKKHTPGINTFSWALLLNIPVIWSIVHEWLYLPLV